MPDAAWAVSVHPPSLSREKGQPPVLTSSNPLSTLHRRFAYARLSQSCLPESRSGFPQRSPPWLLTTAACGGLRPAPDCRPRRAHLHLSYSCTCRLDRHARDTRPKADITCHEETPSLIPFLTKGRERNHLPVAAKIALASAGPDRRRSGLANPAWLIIALENRDGDLRSLYALPLPVQNDGSKAAPDHLEGNVFPNMGRPLTDASLVASSSTTSQCSASWPFSRRTISTTIQFAGTPMPENRPWSST